MMDRFTENCMVCGKPLVYCVTAQTKNCCICGAKGSAASFCEDEHYVCDTCHAEKGVLLINSETRKIASRNPVKIATGLMQNEEINMHGPEHHFLVVASLLAAYKNAGGQIDLEIALQSALQRAKNVPGGVCGMWGSCGAGIASGIFASIVTGATPLSEREWSLANKMTTQSLAVISENGGPRCCKRNSYLAIYQAAMFAKENFSITLELPERIVCAFSHRNVQCRKDRCLFYAER